MGTKYVYFFGNGEADGRGEMKNLLGGKGANLAEMTAIGLPVPPGFTISTEVCTAYYKYERNYPACLPEEVTANMLMVEEVVGNRFGDPANPLLVSVRSGARASMPGMMDTILNLGLNDATVQGVIAKSGDARFAYDAYRRFVQMYSDVVLDVKKDIFEHQMDEVKAKRGVKLDTDLTADDLRELVATFKATVLQQTGKPFPDDPVEQLWGLRLVDEPARHHLSPPQQYPGRLGDRGQRSGDGLRQHGG